VLVGVTVENATAVGAVLGLGSVYAVVSGVIITVGIAIFSATGPFYSVREEEEEEKETEGGGDDVEPAAAWWWW
jgi:hypothetical protein